jgi:hypothetical protein
MRDFPRLLRPVAEPLGLYLRPNPRDHRFLADFLAGTSPAGLKGVIFDAALDNLQADLRVEVQAHGVQSVVDLRGMELATVGGFRGEIRRLPWAGLRPDSPSDFTSARMTGFVDAIVEWVVERRFSAVEAPTHYLARGSNDPWLALDLEIVNLMRERLDAAGAKKTLIYYPLAVHADAFFHVVERDKLRTALSRVLVDALLLRVHPFGTNCGAQALRRYIRACGEFNKSGRPIIAEKCGVAGLVLLAFGSAGALESGLTTGDRFDFGRLLRNRSASKGGFAQPRVYISELQSFLTPACAKKFFEKRLATSYYGCKDDLCCKRGVPDMLANPRLHFLLSRPAEVERLSGTPESMRPDVYLEQFLRPATDMLVKAANAEPSLAKARSRLDAWRTTLSEVLKEDRPRNFSPPPNGHRLLMQLGA